jgi:hypothetical protein
MTIDNVGNCGSWKGNYLERRSQRLVRYDVRHWCDGLTGCVCRKDVMTQEERFAEERLESRWSEALMNYRPIRVSIAVFLLALMAAPVLAQSSHDEWLALRTRKQARHHRLPGPATRSGAFTITAIRFFSDPAGNLVGVGEARNDTNFDLSYSRINFTFLDANGAELGRDWTYLHGGVNARLVGNNANETLLVPGATGFFKIWTTIPSASMASYTAQTAGEELAYVTPRATFGADRPERWLPRLYFVGAGPLAITGGRISGNIWNDDPYGFGSPSGLDRIFTYSVQVSVAVYQDGVISDVGSAIAIGGTSGGSCRGEPVTGMSLHQSASFTLAVAQPANRIGQLVVEWQDTVVSPLAPGFFQPPLTFLGQGGPATFTVGRECGWTATTSTPWITIADGAASTQTGGQVTVNVAPNPTGLERTGVITVSGENFPIIQGVPCDLVFNREVFLGSGRQDYVRVTGVPTSCVFGVRATAPWLTAIPSGDALWLSAEPNLSPVTRSAVVTVGPASFTVHQRPASRNTDFNNDGHLDLLWRHRDGWIATWRMNALQMIDGTLLTPSRGDRNTTPVGTGDLDNNGSTDVLWQNDVTGAPAIWLMTGTSVLAPDSVSFDGTTASSQKIRAVADFNRDGHPDFVWQDERTGEIFVWFMQSAPSQWLPMRQLGTAPLGPGVVTDLNWKIVGSGDFNGDGWPDLVWQHQRDGRIAVWKMQRTILLEGSLITPAQVTDLDWKIRAVGDINGDDMPDLIWQHRADGRVAAWVMNGTTMTYGIVIAQVPDTGWEIVGPR